MSTSESASLIAVEAGMTILPLLSNSTSKARNSDRLFGWPQSSDMAQRAMEVLGKSLCCLQITALTCSQHMQLGTKAVLCMAVTAGLTLICTQGWMPQTWLNPQSHTPPPQAAMPAWKMIHLIC